MKYFGYILLGIVAMSALAYGCFTLMVRLIPAGEPRALVAKPFNDPKDFTPCEPNVLPAGPHQDEFANNCIACHSTRLTMTQPNFTAAKWGEVVKKMISVYGAKIDPPMETQIVEYLSSVKGIK